MNPKLSYLIDEGTESERIVCRVRIHGSYNGVEFVYEDDEETFSQFIWTKDNDPSEFWWSDGNYSCDCNRRNFLPEHLKITLPDDTCGCRILIEKIVPIDESLPELYINETE